MKKVLKRIGASVFYILFLFLVLVFVSAVTAKPGRFRNGDPVSDGQRVIYIFVFFLMMVIAGCGAFKSAQRDLRLWRMRHKKKDDDHVA
jgi:hypothetical protein